jgi:tRNA (cmo5U34)-methyltransferase
MLSLLQSFYIHFVRDGSPKAVLDLGCGDGVVTSVLADADASISATLVDGSADMLAKAKERLRGLKNARYIHANFQELIREDRLDRDFDLIASSLAIHHLSMEEKTALFKRAYDRLRPGGHFVNIDVVLAPNEPLEQWYLSLWKDWIKERKRVLEIGGDKYEEIVEQYKDNRDNQPDTLDSQLDAMRRDGFHDVDCYYKYGIFTMFGGRK